MLGVDGTAPNPTTLPGPSRWSDFFKKEEYWAIGSASES
jgi:hypothetical protein